MTFEEILDQAIAMLQRRGRVTYRALKRQFQLDDAYLQDLNAELVEVLQLAVDEDEHHARLDGRHQRTRHLSLLLPPSAAP